MTAERALRFEGNRKGADAMQEKRRGFTIIEFTIIAAGILFAVVAVYFGVSR